MTHERSALGALARTLRHILFPAVCPVCGALGEDVCPGCLASLVRSFASVCMECGRPAPCTEHADAPQCRGVSSFRGENRDLVHAMKYRGARHIARRIGREIGRVLPSCGAECLIPVPLHIGSERDHNQAALIARGIADIWGARVVDALAWRVRSPSQAKKSHRMDRVLPERAIISQMDLSSVGRICVVDDIYTTGATFRAAASAIREAGGDICCGAVWSVS